MTGQRKIILHITPETHVRTVQADKWFFRIPRERLRPPGLKRLLRIEKYNNYKVELLAEAKRKNFQIPAAGLAVTFFIPVPPSWSKKKKKEHHGKLCFSKFDIDNACKAFFDGLLTEDKYIANITLTKRWVDSENGWIECLISEFTEEQMLIVPSMQE